MFSVIPTSNSVILQSSTSSAEIYPQCGAILNRWSVQAGGKVWEIIDGYESTADFEKNCEAKGFRSAKLSPYVCRMNKSQYDFGSQHYHIGKYELAGNAIHGLLYNNSFSVVNMVGDEQAAALVLQHDYNGSDEGYPFTYRILVSYVLQANNDLGITTSVTNTSSVSIPMADGWHPYFSLGRKVDELQFSMQTNSILEFDKELIPTGQLLDFNQYHEPTVLGDQFFDNCFLLNKPLEGPACKLVNVEEGIELSIYPDDGYPYLQVYTPPHRNSIAIENLSAAPDAFNNHIGLVVLEPGESHSFTTHYVVGMI
jgi:aldose 1-epimerase